MANAIPRFLSIPLRLGELVFAAVVAGLTGKYLHSLKNARLGSQKRFIYTEVVAALSMLLALIWLIPITGGFIHYPIDFILFVAWIVAFGLLVDFIGPLNCGSVFSWGDNFGAGTCQQWKADVAFAFLSAIFWLVSALVGVWFVHRSRRAVTKESVSRNPHRRRWFRSRRV
ncbi:MAG: hypothetical protein M1825_001383 [Sarcosagium campestre]|nr:MAG: hypothetical protein M1825_001383 [Sarcosagium campestre]